MIQIKLHHFSTWQNMSVGRFWCTTAHLERNEWFMPILDWSNGAYVHARYDRVFTSWPSCGRTEQTGCWSSTQRWVCRFTTASPASRKWHRSILKWKRKEYINRQQSHRCKREGKWNVRHSASGRVKEEYLETDCDNAVCLHHTRPEVQLLLLLVFLKN